MKEPVRKIVECLDAGDGTGDLMIQLPPEVVASMKIGPGDSLNIELVHGALVFTPISRDESKS